MCIDIFSLLYNFLGKFENITALINTANKHKFVHKKPSRTIHWNVQSGDDSTFCMQWMV